MYEIPCMCCVRKQGGVELYNYTFFFFFMEETLAPSTVLKSVVSHKGIQMSLAATFEVFIVFLGPKEAAGKGCWSQSPGISCWSPGQLLQSIPKGPNQCAPVASEFSTFLLLCSLISLSFYFDWKPSSLGSCLQDCL